MSEKKIAIAQYHLPGLFEFYEFYKIFLSLFYNHREYFYEWCDIASVYGAPEGCIWGGGRVEASDAKVEDVLSLLKKYGISARLTFSNSLLREEHLQDKKCNKVCELFEKSATVQNGAIVHSELLVEYLKEHYPDLYLVSSTTKVLTAFDQLKKELEREDFRYVVPDFRLNKKWEQWERLNQIEKDKLEFLCNECCDIGCMDRKECYESVSQKLLGEDSADHICSAPYGSEGYRFSKAMSSPAFIGINDIKEKYLPKGFSNFKIEGRGLGSAMLLEFLLYYMVKPEYHIVMREEIYLDSMLDLF